MYDYEKNCIYDFTFHILFAYLLQRRQGCCFRYCVDAASSRILAQYNSPYTLCEKMFSVRKDYTTAINDMSADEASTSFALPVNAFDPEANIGSGWLGCGENRDQALSSNGFSTCAKYTYYRFTKRINNNYYGATQVVVTTTPTYYPTSVSYTKTAQVRFYSDALKFYNTSGILYRRLYPRRMSPQVRDNNFSAGISGTGKGIGGFSFEYGISTTTSDLNLDNRSQLHQHQINKL